MISARQRRFDAALASSDRALAAQPNHAGALCNPGVTLHELKRFDEALASYDRARSNVISRVVADLKKLSNVHETRAFA